MLTTLLRPKAVTPAADDDFWYESAGRVTASGEKMTTESALRIAAYYACVRVKAETLASLPLILYRERADGGKDRAKEHPAYPRFNRQPNPWQTRFEFVEMLTGHVVMRGDAFARIIPQMGGDFWLVPLNPDRMKVEQIENYRLRYQYRGDDGIDIPYSQDEIFHLRAFSLDGLVGLDPIDVQGDTLGTARSAELYAGRFWKNDATPGGALKHPGKLSDKAFNHLQQSFAEYRGMNQHKPRIFEEGMEWQQLGIDAEKAQVIESRRLSAEDICRMERVPPFMIGLHEKGTAFGSVEQQAIDFVTHTMRPYAVRWELAADRDLIDEEGLFVEFLLDALLRGTTADRYGAYSIGIQSRFLSPNEVRAMENLNPYDGGDEFENPNVTPDPGPSGGGGQEEETSAEPQWLAIMIDDVADKMTRPEVRDWRRKLSSANPDDLAAWKLKLYEGRSEHAEKCLIPLAKAAKTIDRVLAIDEIVSQYRRTACPSAEGFEDWATERHGQVVENIRGNLK